MLLGELHDLIAAACPIAGIDSSGIINYLPSATPAQQAAAQSIMQQSISQLNGIPATPVVDLATQIATALLAKGTLTNSDFTAENLASVDAGAQELKTANVSL